MAEDLIIYLAFLASLYDLSCFRQDVIVVRCEGLFFPESLGQLTELVGCDTSHRLLVVKDRLRRKETFNHHSEKVRVSPEENSVPNYILQVFVCGEVTVIGHEVDRQEFGSNNDVRVIFLKLVWLLV